MLRTTSRVNIMTSTNTTITPLVPNDEISICAEIFSTTEPWITFGMDTNHFMKMLSNPLNEVYTLKVEHVIAGVIIIQMQGPFPGYIKSIVIDKKWEGNGYGRQLLEFSEQRIFKDSPNVFLCVSSFNDKAIPFYQKLGYEKVGELENYLIVGESEIIMRKTLGPVLGY